MEKLIFNVSDINSKNEKFVIIDKWYEKLIKLTPDNKLNLRYLNEYKFSIKKEKESFKEVDEVYEKLLQEITIKLNNVHNTNWSSKAWRIFIGPWLNRFVAIIYDRTEIVLPLLKNLNVDCSKQTKIGSCVSLSSHTMRDFTDKTLKKKWNDELFCRIIYLLKTNNFNNEENLNACHNLKFESFKTRSIYYFYFFNFFIFKLIVYPITFFNKFVFYKSYFGNFLNLSKLILILKDIPFRYSFSFFDNFIVKKNFDKKLRSKVDIFENSPNIKEKITRFLLTECLPTFYLEGFKDLKKITNNSFLPNKKKVIITFNCWKDNIFKYWLAYQSNQGSKIIYGQHGAGYGTNLGHYAEKHELKISDNYLSWGWKSNQKILPLGDFSTNKKKKFTYVNNKKILIVSGNVNVFKFNNIIHDKNQVFKKHREINEFLDELDVSKVSCLDFKEHPNEKRRIFSTLKMIKNSKTKINSVIKESNLEKILDKYQLIIYPYQFATPFLKYLNLNKPSISLFKKDYLNENVKKDFEPLFEAKILHESSLEMAKFLNQNFDKMQNWWEDQNTQKARINFCGKYIKKNIDFEFFIKSLNEQEKLLYK
jgi:putative transferase (TIGR04331 family)